MAVVTIQVLGNNPNGIRVIELSNWKGHIFVIPRSFLSDLRERAELNQPGVYYLIGEGQDKPTLYVGQSDNCYGRLTSHDRTREDDEWNTAIVFTGGLHSTYTRYLESISVRLARDADRYEIANRTDPTEAVLTGAQKETADEFFEKIKYLITFLGYQFFQKVSESLSDQAFYFLKADNADARAQLLEDGSLNVLKDSLARVRETEAFFGWSKAARQKFLEDGTLKKEVDGLSYIFTRDVVFNSPTAAAATVTGRPINGWTAWKDDQGNTLDENVRR